MIAVAPSNDIFVERFLGAIGLTHLLEEARFSTNKTRLRHRDALRDLINAKTEAHEVSHWIEILNQAGVPAGRVQTLDQVFNDPQVLAQDMVLATTCGDVDVKVTGFPVKLSATPARLQRPPPTLGEHTDTVLERLGFSAAEIKDLREAKVV